MKMRMRGALIAADVVGMREMVRAILDERGSCFVVADANGLTGIEADARRAMADWGRSHPDDRASGVVVYGVNFVTRTLITLTVNAVKLLGYREVELKFTRDEAESLDWVDEQRTTPADQPYATG